MIHTDPSGGWRAVDYKTDLEPSAKAGIAYEVQLEAYKRALLVCHVDVDGAEITYVRGKA